MRNQYYSNSVLVHIHNFKRAYQYNTIKAMVVTLSIVLFLIIGLSLIDEERKIIIHPGQVVLFHYKEESIKSNVNISQNEPPRKNNTGEKSDNSFNGGFLKNIIFLDKPGNDLITIDAPLVPLNYNPAVGDIDDGFTLSDAELDFNPVDYNDYGVIDNDDKTLIEIAWDKFPKGITRETFYIETNPDIPALIEATEKLRYPKKLYYGTVILEIIVNADGEIEDLSVLKEEPEGKGFLECAVRYIETCKIKPAEKNGRKVNTRITVNVEFCKDCPFKARSSGDVVFRESGS